MTPRQHGKRKRNGTDRQNHRLPPLRTAFVLLAALLIGAAAAILFYLARRPVSLAVVSGIGVFALTVSFVDKLID